MCDWQKPDRESVQPCDPIPDISMTPPGVVPGYVGKNYRAPEGSSPPPITELAFTDANLKKGKVRETLKERHDKKWLPLNEFVGAPELCDSLRAGGAPDVSDAGLAKLGTPSYHPDPPTVKAVFGIREVKGEFIDNRTLADRTRVLEIRLLALANKAQCEVENLRSSVKALEKKVRVLESLLRVQTALMVDTRVAVKGLQPK